MVITFSSASLILLGNYFLTCNVCKREPKNWRNVCVCVSGCVCVCVCVIERERKKIKSVEIRARVTTHNLTGWVLLFISFYLAVWCKQGERGVCVCVCSIERKRERLIVMFCCCTKWHSVAKLRHFCLMWMKRMGNK